MEEIEIHYELQKLHVDFYDDYPDMVWRYREGIFNVPTPVPEWYRWVKITTKTEVITMGLDLDLYVEVDTGGKELYYVELWSKNITHNLGTMASHLGIYVILWRPAEEQRAKDMIAPLENAIDLMKKMPDVYKVYEPANKWGTLENFLPWLEDLLEACKIHPEAKVRASV